MVEYTPVGVRVFGGFAIQAGAYTFGWQGADGATVETQAHFSFKFRREREGWSIVDHQSSAMPREPEELKHVSSPCCRHVPQLNIARACVGPLSCVLESASLAT